MILIVYNYIWPNYILKLMQITNMTKLKVHMMILNNKMKMKKKITRNKNAWEIKARKQNK